MCISVYLSVSLSFVSRTNPFSPSLLSHLHRYAEQRDVRHKKVGKLIVATSPAERPALRGILAQARANGLGEAECRLVSGADALALEPALCCEEALLCEQTGVVDAPHLLQQLHADLLTLGVGIVQQCAVQSAEWLEAARCWQLHTAQGALQADVLVNAAGLLAPRLARRITPPSHCCRTYQPPQHVHYAKGTWFRLAGAAVSPFQRLVYPLPRDGGLGTHSTVDCDGNTRFGPNVQWLAAPASTSSSGEGSFSWHAEQCSADDLQPFYAVEEEEGGEAHYDDIRRYWPGLPDGALLADSAGIRPKLSGPGETPADFLLHGPRAHGAPGLFNLLGVESPGLTAALAIAEEVADELLLRE